MTTVFDYTNLLNTAKRMTDRFGRTVDILKFNENEQDAGKPWKGSANPRLTPDFTVNLKVVFINPSSAVNLGIATESSDLIKNSQKIMIVAPGSVVTEDLSLADEVEDSPERWKVVGVTTLKPGDVTLLYFIGVKR